MYNRAFSIEALRTAWYEVQKNDLEDGSLSAAAASFVADIDDNLSALSRELLDKNWVPHDLVEVRLPKPNGEKRVLHIPAVEDRIVERALLAVLVPVIDPWLSPAAFGYRHGRGVADAIQAVVTLRDEGRSWAVRADIDDCFPNLDVARIVRLAAAQITDEDVIELLKQLLSRCTIGPGGRHPFPGLPQGSPLSPLLCNLALEAFDSEVATHGFPLVRYADDFVLACRNESEARTALLVASAAIERLDMSLDENKTEVMSFDDGFVFLGEDFGPRYPPVLNDHRIDEPALHALYVARQGGRVRVSRGRVLVESENDVELLSLPQTEVGSIMCFGSVGLSAGAREWALREGVQVVFLSRRGSYQGLLLPPDGRSRNHRLRAQLALPPERALSLGAVVIEAKLLKQAALLRHFVREESADVVTSKVAMIRGLLPMVPEAKSRDELMGLEGAAAREYFAGLAALLPRDVVFSGRNRQPPLDVVNAALSYGYSILTGEATAAIVAAGLDPGIGCLHAESRNQPAAALDLMEEFRPLIVDQVVVQLFRKGTLGMRHGTTISGKTGIYLSKAGRACLIDAYERRMLTSVRALPDFAGSYRRHLYRQAQRLCAAICGTDGAYTGMSWR
ncbi:MAG: CRISPR-associated endonuclease Cas1 [Propionibacteriaceae bacterium]|jgi:CRISPR-associated protein Cas1|nr:CRISPR-associated endonuclease Cas1 [Propionibacteriaceae bacterium]